MLCITKRKNHYIKIGEDVTIYYCSKKSRYYIKAPKEVGILNTLIDEDSSFSKFIKKETDTTKKQLPIPNLTI